MAKEVKGKTSGTFKIFDSIASFLVRIFSYIVFGLKAIWKYLKIVITFIWTHFLHTIYSELVKMIVAASTGFLFIFTTIFVTYPEKISAKAKKNKNEKLAKSLYKEEKIDAEKVEKTVKKDSALDKIKKYFSDKYNEISFVKEAEKKKIDGLTPLKLDMNGPDGIKSAVKLTYRYLAQDENGRLVKGYFPAFSKLDVYSYLSDANMIVYEIETNKMINFLHTESNIMKKDMTRKDLVFWLAQLSTYIKAGIPLADAVKILAQQDKRNKYKSLYSAVIYELTMGEPFSEALRKQGSAFPSLLINMIKSSEMTGTIEETLDDMSSYYQELEDTKKAIISAIAYPLIVSVFAIAVVIFMFVYLVPKFVDVYESMNAEVSGLTAIVIKISDFLKGNYIFILVFIAAIILAFIYLFKNIKAFRVIIQTFGMRLPVVGKLIISKEMNMFSRTFASLQKNNILLTDSIDILAKITSNEIYKELELRTIDNLIKGNKMSETFQNHWAIPDVAYFMIVTGESTGELAEMLDKVADFYKKEEDNAVSMIKTFTEPILILFLAVVVGFILVAILVPMFEIYGQVS